MSDFNVITEEEKLLFAILQELRGIRQSLQQPTTTAQPPSKVEKPQESKQVVRPIAKGAELSCKICGEKFDNKGKLMSHYKNHKKAGV